MRQIGYTGYSRGTPSRFGARSGLAEEELARRQAEKAAFLEQLSRMGDLTAEGITAQGEALSGAIDKGVQGYQRGKKMSEESEAHKRRMELSEQELADAKAEREFLDSPAEEAAEVQGPPRAGETKTTKKPRTYRQMLTEAKIRSSSGGRALGKDKPPPYGEVIKQNGITYRWNYDANNYEPI